MESILNTLKTVYGADAELREGDRSFKKEYAYEGMPSLRFGGLVMDAFELDGEGVNVERTTIGNSDAFIISFFAAGKAWEARVGHAALNAREAEEKATADAADAAKAEAEALIAARKERTDPTSFHFEGRIGSSPADRSVMFVEAPAGTFVVGDRVTVPGRREGFPPVELVVTGLGKDFARDGAAVHRGYVMFAKDYDALPEAEQAKLPKNEDEAIRARTDESKKAAKALGGKALKGTAKQKAWAEQIRKDALSRVSAETAERLLSDAKFQSARFWIDNRTALSRGQVAGLI